MTRYYKYHCCKWTLETSQYLERPPFQKTCWKESGGQQRRWDGEGAEGELAGARMSPLLVLLKEGCPGRGRGCLGSFKGSQPLFYPQTSCWFSEELPTADTHALPFEKIRSNCLLIYHKLKLKIKRDLLYQRTLGHYSWFGLETQRWKALHAISDSQESLHPHPPPSFCDRGVLLNPGSQQPLHPKTGRETAAVRRGMDS